MKEKEKTYRYSRLLKDEILSEIQKEKLTVLQASKYYQIPFPTIYYWIKRSGQSNPNREVVFVSLKDKNEIINENERLKAEVRQLKDLVSKLSLDKLCLETIVEVAKTDLNIDLKKNYGNLVSKESKKK